MEKIRMVLLATALASGAGYLALALPEDLAPGSAPAMVEASPAAPATEAAIPSGSSVITISNVTGGTASFATTSAVYVTSGTLTLIDTGSGQVRTPPFTMVCTEEGCQARGASMEQAREMLERIANRGIQVDVTVDQNCHPQHETISPRAAEVAVLSGGDQ